MKKDKNPDDFKINVRVINILRYFSPKDKNMSQKEFSELLNVSPGRVNHIFKYQNKPDSEFLENLALAFPTLNCRWLLTGEGEALEITEPESKISKSIFQDSSGKWIAEVISSKDALIESLQNQLKVQEKYIEKLESQRQQTKSRVGTAGV